MKLTAKQEKFCQNIVAGMTQIDAYVDAYNTENYESKDALYVKASELASVGKVAVRINQLKAPAVEKLQLSAEKLLNDLKNIAENPENRLGDRLKAYEMLGKHLKLFTERQEIDLNGELGVIRLPMKLPEGAPVQTNFGERVDFEGGE